MITLQTENLENFKSQSETLEKHLKSFLSKDREFLKVLDDDASIEKILAFAKENKKKYEHFVLVGIGGSALGAACLQQSLTHLFKNKLHILDNVDPVLISELEDVIDYSKTLFLVISKSGNTIETLTTYDYFKEKCTEKGLKLSDHFVFVTNPNSGKLKTVAENESIKTFDVPEKMSGRFSSLAAVGLLPAALIGIDIKKIIEGAKEMREKALSKDPKVNLAFRLAEIQYSLFNKGKTINVLMPYSQKLKGLSDWYRQLLAESIGKKHNNEGKEVFTGITPITALGATDQHSQLQLYSEGPNDKLIIFIELEKYEKDSPFEKLIKAEIKGTIQALTKNGRPNIKVQVDSISEKSLGELIILFEMSVAFLGEFFQINAFNQPGVELSKKITKELLEKI